MRENPSPYPLRITICGIDELADHAGAGVTHVLSILDPVTPEPSAFARFGPHRRLELRFHDVIEDDRPGYVTPARQHIVDLLAFGQEMMRAGNRTPHLLVHCHMGISRSTAAAALMLAEAAPDRPPAEIVAEIARVREKAWPNLRMIELGDALLGRNGEIVRAVRQRHRHMAAKLPQVADFMRASGRARELE
jgi:predicted protein tyrosine phosphatase